MLLGSLYISISRASQLSYCGYSACSDYDVFDVSVVFDVYHVISLNDYVCYAYDSSYDERLQRWSGCARVW